MTKSFKIFQTAGLAFVLTASPALAGEEGDNTYATVHAGYNILDNWPARVDFGGGIAFDGNLALEGNVEVGAAVGRNYGDWRAELEYQRGYFGITSATLDGTTVNTDATAHYDTIMLNGYRDFDLTSTLSVFGGAGVGWSKLSMPKIAFDPSCDCFGAASKSGFAYQLRAGVEYDVTDRLSFYGQYNRLFLHETIGTGTPSVSYVKKNFGIASVGLRLALGQSRRATTPPVVAAKSASMAAAEVTAEPAQVVEAPAPTPAPAPAPITEAGFIVYFDLDKADIDEAAKVVLNKAIKAYADSGMVAVKLTGMADRSGSVGHNQVLSQKRVSAVASYLVTNGVPQTAITASATGESSPRVATADGIAERENRIVELKIRK